MAAITTFLDEVLALGLFVEKYIGDMVFNYNMPGFSRSTMPSNKV